MNKNLFLSQEDRHSEESPLIYKWAKPVTALKAKRDADGFIAPWAMFRPLGDKGLFSAMLGESAVRRAADLRLNRDLLLKEIYEHEIEQLMCRVRLSEIETQQKFVKEDRAMELYQQAEAASAQDHLGNDPEGLAGCHHMEIRLYPAVQKAVLSVRRGSHYPDRTEGAGCLWK